MSTEPHPKAVAPKTPSLSELRITAGAQVEECLYGSVVGSASSFWGAIAAAVLGAMGARVGGQPSDDWVQLLGGATGAAIGGLLVISFIRRTFRPIWVSLVWFVIGLTVAALVSRPVFEHVAGPVFRWAVGGFLTTVVGGALSGPLRAVRRQGADLRKAGLRVQNFVVALAAPIKLVNRQILGCALAGMVGGAVGGALVGLLMGRVGGQGGLELYGGENGATEIGAALGAVSGLYGSVAAWLQDAK